MDNILLFLLFIAVIGAVLFAGIIRLNRQKIGLDHAYYAKSWDEIVKDKNSGSMQMAIMEADKLVDHAMKSRGIRGETMGERLKSAKGMFRNNDDVWRSHKLRNRLAHEHGTKLNIFVTEQALKGFKSALKDLGAL